MNVLVIDVGGTGIKLLATGKHKRLRFDSGPLMSAKDMVAGVKKAAADAGWSYDVISMGYPGPVVHDCPMAEPHNLAKGWVKFDYAKAFGHPIKIINDAAMQALGSHNKGRMLFLGLGTGLGSAMVAESVVTPMELAHLPYKNGRTYEDYLGMRGLLRSGRKKWRKHVLEAVDQLRAALQAEYVVLGGGNARLMKKLPSFVRLGDNNNAFRGGFRLWKKKHVKGISY
ncbi:MAG TPA: ROK family protein [Verrucomicrobiae bacterium]